MDGYGSQQKQTRKLNAYAANHKNIAKVLHTVFPLLTLETLTGKSVVFVVVVFGARDPERKCVEVCVVVDIHRLKQTNVFTSTRKNAFHIVVEKPC